MGDLSRNLSDLPAPQVYHYEYVSLHNQRIALVRRIDLWYQIALPTSILIFGTLVTYGTGQQDRLMVALGAVFPSALLLLTYLYTRGLDQGVVNLYPRIITLELLLDFRFYRTYLRGCGDPARRFVETCEALDAETTAQLSAGIQQAFCRDDFPWRRRRPPILGIGIIVVIAAFWVMSAYVIYRLTCS